MWGRGIVRRLSQTDAWPTRLLGRLDALRCARGIHVQLERSQVCIRPEGPQADPDPCPDWAVNDGRDPGAHFNPMRGDVPVRPHTPTEANDLSGAKQPLHPGHHPVPEIRAGLRPVLTASEARFKLTHYPKLRCRPAGRGRGRTARPRPLGPCVRYSACVETKIAPVSDCALLPGAL